MIRRGEVRELGTVTNRRRWREGVSRRGAQGPSAEEGALCLDICVGVLSPSYATADGTGLPI